MEQNTHKFRLRLNLFDGIILALALGVAALLLWTNLKPAAAEPGVAATTSTVRYTVRFQNWPEGVSELIEPGDLLVDNVKKYEMGHVVSYEVVPARSSQLDHFSRKYVMTEYEGYEDILVTVEAPCTESDESVVVGGGYEVRVGTVAYIKGEGYMASGPIVAIEREVQG